jgi:hypothetical protein
MSQVTTAGGASQSGLVLLVVSVLAGLGMSFAAVASIVAANGPKDDAAVTTGQQTVLTPDQMLNYGG